MLHRAHVTSSPRVEDVRIVVILCPFCHGVAHGIRFAGNERPKLTVGNLLYLKRLRDPENFDREFLQRYSVQILPRAVRPPLVFRLEYHRRRAA